MTDPWLNLCRDRPCIACGREDGTIVPAHANQQQFGKGMGLKAANWTCVPLCMACHDWLDKSPADRLAKHDAWKAWWTLHMFALLRAELVAPAGHVPRATPRKSKAPERAAYARPAKVLAHSGVISR